MRPSIPLALTLTALLFLASLLPGQAAVERITLQVDGVSCSLCTLPLKKQLGSLPGVSRVDFDLKSATAVLEASPGGSLALESVRDRVRRAGFTPRQASIRATGRVVRWQESRWALDVAGSPALFVLLPGKGSDALERLVKAAGDRDVAVRVEGPVHTHAGDLPPGLQVAHFHLLKGASR